MYINCTVGRGRFEVRNDDDSVHSAGGVVASDEAAWQRRHPALHKAWRCDGCVDVSTMYMSTNFGPGYRRLNQAWHGNRVCVGRLRARATHQGTALHPADLDAVVTSKMIVSTGRVGLPFAVHAAHLQGVGTKLLWGVSCQSALNHTADRAGCPHIEIWLALLAGHGAHRCRNCLSVAQ